MLNQTHITKPKLNQILIINHVTTAIQWQAHQINRVTVGMISNIILTITQSVNMTHIMRKVTIIIRQRAIIGQGIIQLLFYTRQRIKTQSYTLILQVIVMLISMANSIIYISIVTKPKRITMSLRFLSTMILNLAISISMRVSDMDPLMTHTWTIPLTMNHQITTISFRSQRT